MSNIDIFDKAEKLVGSGNVKAHEPMSRHTTFRIGGPADYFVKPGSPEQVSGVIDLCREYNLPFFVLGNGSNLLVSDSGYRGMVINISDNMNRIYRVQDRLHAQAGAMLARVSMAARDEALTGLEFASGIPGTIGGAVYMNAGAYGGEMKDVVLQVRAMDYQGIIYTFDKDDMCFAYRHSIVGERNLIVLDTILELKEGDCVQISERMRELSAARQEKQPLEFPSAGSTFKRPEGYYAGKLIMDSGLRGYSVGGAQVSEKHCGFVVNKGGATASDVINLIEHVQNTVFEKFGVKLEPEVRLLGQF